MSVDINKSEFPNLFQESPQSWGPVRAVFELGDEPPSELIGNVNIAPYIGDDWLIIRQENGWGVTGGTLEPGETHLQTLRRELLEEAGAELISFTPFGAWRCHTSAPKPYRPHLPWPEFYRIVGYGEVKLVGKPENPADGEQILEVAAFPIEETCRRLAQRPGDGPQLAELYRLASLIRAQAE